MRRHPLLLLAALAALTGALLAGGLAVALPGADRIGTASGGAADTDVARRPAPATSAANPAHPRIGRARADVRGFGRGWMRATGPARAEARAPDPRGGPPWALRIVPVQRLVERRDGTLRPMGRSQLCAQLGRELDGRFGWIDAANRFRPSAGIVYRSNPILCGPQREDLGRQPQIELLTRVIDLPGGISQPLQSVAWGFAGADGAVDLSVDGRRRVVATTPHAAVLLPLPPSPRRSGLRAAVRYSRGGAIAIDDSFRGQASRTASRLREMSRRLHRPPERSSALPRQGSQPTLEYRVADPTSGLPLGMVAAPAQDGRWCASELAEIVGPRVGVVDHGLGTLRDVGPAFGSGCGRPGADPTRARPIAWGASFAVGKAGIEPPSPRARRQRTIRRTLPGTTSIYGSAHPDVVAITIATPRDVRTITPSPRAHVFAAIYDGGFPTGEISISARMKDGTVHRERPLGGF